MSPPEFRFLLKYSVGYSLMAAPKACPECSKLMDVFGYHALSCRQKSSGIHRHNSIVLSIVKHMKAANLSWPVEECNPMNDTRERPGDIYIAEFDSLGHGPGDAFFDISVIHICAESYIRRASVGQLSKIRYNEKILKYPDLESPWLLNLLGVGNGWYE